MYHKDIPIKLSRLFLLLALAVVLLTVVPTIGSFISSSANAQTQNTTTQQRTECSSGTCVTTTCVNGACTTTTSSSSGSSNYVSNTCSNDVCYVKICTNGVCTTTSSTTSPGSTSVLNTNINNVQQSSSLPSPPSPTQSACIQTANTSLRAAISAAIQHITEGSLTDNQAIAREGNSALNNAISAYHTAITSCIAASGATTPGA